ncbi:MAG TPA: tRNA1(Val) (adenine(37)-N6)-methyltransferase [Patescibacteria group bacterium]|nr:tRNA1(Val) (adenine(37)-N6)-methyltransferase [Patescibacteria group bacterium]
MVEQEQNRWSELLPGERLDDLIIGGRKIIQRPDQFCFSLDAILLAHFATVKPAMTAVDLGAGTGVLGLLLTARGAGAVTGVEINPEMAEMANRSAAGNGLAGAVRTLAGDLRQIRELLPGGGWHLVVSNPPYRQTGSGYITPRDSVAMARHEITATLTDIVTAARYLLKYRGRFAMVHLPERLADITTAMRQADIEPKRMQLVQPRSGQKPNMVLVEGVRGANPGLEVLPVLTVYNSDGGYDAAVSALYRDR